MNERKSKGSISCLWSMVLLSVLGACSSSSDSGKDGAVSAEDAATDTVRVLLQRDSMGLGALPLFSQSGLLELGLISGDYQEKYLDSSEEVRSQWYLGQGDLAFLSAIDAATLYNEGAEISVVAIGSYASLFLLSQGETLENLGDLAGELIFLGDSGGKEQYVLEKLLRNSGVLSGGTVSMPQQELESQMLERGGFCLVAEPYASQLLWQSEELHGLSVTSLWNSMVGASLPMGCVVARQSDLQENPAWLQSFLQDYEEAVSFMQGDFGAELAVEEGYFSSQAVAEAGLLGASLDFVSGEVMQNSLQSFYVQLFREDPNFVGGGLPYDDFYYGLDG